MLIAHEYLLRHNAAVASGSWALLGELFCADAALTFEGFPHPPAHGRAAIVAAFAARPPAGTLVPRVLAPVPDGAVLRYAWNTAPEREAGSLRFVYRDGLIDHLVIAAAIPAFAVLYRFVVHPGQEPEFLDVWQALTHHITLTRSSFGSRLHRAGPLVYIAYAQWPSPAAWSAPGAPAPELAARLKAACALIEVLHELEFAADLLL